MLDRIQDLQASLGPQADQLQEQAAVLVASAREKWTEGQAMARNFIEERPAQALAFALGLGVALGWLIKRR